MSLITLIHVPGGIVMSADSRVTVNLQGFSPEARQMPPQMQVDTRFVVSDNCEKLFMLGPQCAAGYFGDAMIAGSPVEVHIRAFIRQHAGQWPAAPGEVALHLLDHLHSLQRPRAQLNLLFAGYDGEEPYVFALDVNQNTLRRLNFDETKDAVTYGIVRGGDTDVIDRLLSAPALQPRADMLKMQDAVDLSRFLIRTTMEQMEFEPRFPTVGGPIDTLTLQPDECIWLQRKRLHV